MWIDIHCAGCGRVVGNYHHAIGGYDYRHSCATAAQREKRERVAREAREGLERELAELRKRREAETLAWWRTVRNRVAYEVERMTGLEIAAVEVHIEAVKASS